jgi:Bacterial TSP3 repeat
LNPGTYSLSLRVSDLDGNIVENLVEMNVVSNTDCDGMPDEWEIQHGFDLGNANDAVIDNDQDGVINLEEYRLGLDPHNPDSDGDGYRDGYEIQMGTNPLDPNSFPGGRKIYMPVINK